MGAGGRSRPENPIFYMLFFAGFTVSRSSPGPGQSRARRARDWHGNRESVKQAKNRTGAAAWCPSE